MSVNQLIQEYGLWAVVLAYSTWTLFKAWGYRQKAKTDNDKLRAETESKLSTQRLEMEKEANRQRYEQEVAAEKRSRALEDRLLKVYEGRLEDYTTRIRELEGQQKVDAKEKNKFEKDLKDVQEQVEKLKTELSDQAIALQAEKRQNMELMDRNDDLQETNEALVKREREALAAKAKLELENQTLQKLLSSLEQRLTDVETDMKHKDSQIESLLQKVMNLETPPTLATGENAIVPESQVLEPLPG